MPIAKLAFRQDHPRVMSDEVIEEQGHFLHSPCIGICELDAATALCQGCGRTGGEIAEWSSASTNRIAAIWRELPGRQEQLKIGTRILPWTPAMITAWARHIVVSKTGKLLLFAHGSMVHVKTGQHANISVVRTKNTLELRTNFETIEINNLHQIRAIALDQSLENTPQKIALTLPNTCMSDQLASSRPSGDPATNSLPGWLTAVAIFTPTT